MSRDWLIKACIRAILPKQIDWIAARQFAVISLINTIFGYGLFVAFIALGCAIEISLLAATVMGVLFNSMTTGRFVFSNLSKQQFAVFVLVYVTIYLLNAAALRLLSILNFAPLISQLLLMPIMAVATFLALNYSVSRWAKR